MKQIKENADIRFSTQSTNFNVWGMPFFTESKRHIFDIAIKQSLETCLYMLFMWTPLVTFIVFKIFFCKRDMNWGKTSHGLAKQNEKQEEKVETAQA